MTEEVFGEIWQLCCSELYFSKIIDQICKDERILLINLTYVNCLKRMKAVFLGFTIVGRVYSIGRYKTCGSRVYYGVQLQPFAYDTI